MALPKIAAPIYELTIPSTGEKIKYRPFLVKEEKVLLMAIEDGSVATMTKAMRDIISACTEGKVKLNDLAPFDLEYFFLQLRGKSIGDTVDLTFHKPASLECGEGKKDCQQTSLISINIDDIKLDSSEVKDSKIPLTDTIGVKVNYPQVETIQKFTGTNEDDEITTENVFKVIVECIEYVWDEEEIFKAKDSTKKELTDFVESLSTTQFMKIKDFLDGMPKLSHTVTWKCPKCEKEAPILLEGIEAFFE